MNSCVIIIAMEYHTPLFDKISDEKRERIITTAAGEFARNGYNAANINEIARKSGISIGALYKYFKTKENLFLTVCMDSVAQLTRGLKEVQQSGGDIFDKFEMIIRMVLKHSRENSEIINLYNEITTEGNRDLASKLSSQMESVSAEYYAGLIEEAAGKGLIDSGIDSRVFAFCLDNLFMTLQFSYASEYYKERMKTYIDRDIFEDDERVVHGIMTFIRRALTGSENIEAGKKILP